MAGSVSQRAFAAQMGVSHQYIGRLCAAGRLPTLPDKSIPIPAGIDAFARERAARSTPSPTADATQYALEIRLATELRKARLAQTTWKARVAELDYKEREGLLLPRAEVVSDVQRCVADARARLLSLPSRIALQLEAVCAGAPPRAPQIEALVTDEINLVLEALYRMRFGTAEPGTAL